MECFEEKRNKIFETRKVREIFDDINLEEENWYFEEQFSE